MMRKFQALILLFCFAFYFSGAQNITVQNLLNDVRLDSLINFVRQLSGEKTVVINGQADTIKSRHYQTIGNEKAFQFMKQELIRYGYQIDSFAFNTNGKNLFAIKPGYKYPNRRFMLGAHYDNQPTEIIAPGADDNASGSSTILEGARIFRNYSFPYTIVFALWDEEEPGLLGSLAYVPTIASGNDTLMGYINVDMLGWDGNNDSVADINVRNIAHSPTLSNKAQQCNTVYNIQLGLHIVNPGNGATDHTPFWDNGYSAIGIDEEYDNDFNPFWHTTADSLGQFNLRYYQKCSKLAYATLADLALDTLNTVAIKENNSTSQLLIYPNPFSEQVNIWSGNNNQPINKIELIDVMGNLVYQTNIKEEYAKINIPEWLQNGIYFLRATSTTNSWIIKMIKQ